MYNNITNLRKRCEEQSTTTAFGAKLLKDMQNLINLYDEQRSNDKLFCPLLHGVNQMLNNLKSNRSQITSSENLSILNYLFEVSEMPIGFARAHEPYFEYVYENDTHQNTYEVITFSTYERLKEIHCDVSEYFTMSILIYSGLGLIHYLGVDEICDTSAYTASISNT